MQVLYWSLVFLFWGGSAVPQDTPSPSIQTRGSETQVTSQPTTDPLDDFIPMVAPKKSYLLLGETYEAEVFLGAVADRSSVSIKVNGRALPVENGKATYQANAVRVGEQKYLVVISVKNPATGKIANYNREFSYRVGLPAASVTADKGNVLYLGVDNPVSVNVAGVPADELRIQAKGASIRLYSDVRPTLYIVRPTAPGKASITVQGGALQPTTFTFRVKRIPDPQVRLGKIDGGHIKAAMMQAQRGLIAWLDNFDFDAKCLVQSSRLVHIPKGKEAQHFIQPGGVFRGPVLEAVRAAQSGDAYQFMNIKARCPGDQVSRSVNSIAILIK